MKGVLVIIGSVIGLSIPVQGMGKNILPPASNNPVIVNSSFSLCPSLLSLTSFENYNNDVVFTVTSDARTQQINIESNTSQPAKVLIYDQKGTIVMASNIFDKTIELNTKKLADGSYFLVISSESGNGLHSYNLLKTVS